MYSVVPFLTRGVFECDIAHCRSVVELCLRYKIKCDQMHNLIWWFSFSAFVSCWLHVMVWSPIGIYIWASCCRTSLSIERSWWPSARWSGTGELYVRGQTSFTDLGCSLHFCLLLLFLSLLSFYMLVLWGWGLRTDGVLITLYQSSGDLYKTVGIIIRISYMLRFVILILWLYPFTWSHVWAYSWKNIIIQEHIHAYTRHAITKVS